MNDPAIEILTIEVGSTITKANGFRRLETGGLEHVAQGFAPTSVTMGAPPRPDTAGNLGNQAHGDVAHGVQAAIANMGVPLRGSPGEVDWPETFVNSSAAGGLRMTVHGLTYSMTARAAREAALGAGAIVKMVTAGKLSDFDLEEIRSIRPNIILLAGGVDFGESATVLANAERLASLGLSTPVLYAGNAAVRKAIQKIFSEAGIEVLIAANVFPDVDVLNIEPLRRLVHEVFNRHIIHAPGMSRFRELTRWGILPTPGAVLLGAELFSEALGDCLVFDVGGATTDVHSVTDGSLDWASRLTEPEPRLKRTVEGDLGVYVNAHNIIELQGDPQWAQRLGDLRALPATEQEQELTHWLCARAVEIGARRHAGVVTDIYSPTGKRQIVKGKDLTAVQWVIGTGGALTRIAGGETILRSICSGPGKYLLPVPEARILMDRDYRFSALGTLAQAYPEDVKLTFQHWVESLDPQATEPSADPGS